MIYLKQNEGDAAAKHSWKSGPLVDVPSSIDDIAISSKHVELSVNGKVSNIFVNSCLQIYSFIIELVQPLKTILYGIYFLK